VVLVLALPLAACSTGHDEPAPVPPPSTASVLPQFPNAANAGEHVEPSKLVAVPEDATHGSGWTWSDGCIQVGTPGVRLNDLDVHGCITVLDGADGVVISDSRVTVSGDTWGIGVQDAQDVVIEDTTVSGGGALLEVGIKDVTGSSSFTVLRCDISDWTTGVQSSRGVVQDSYIHDPLDDGNDRHLNGFTDNGGRTDGTLVIRHNTILNSHDQTDAVSFFEDFGSVRNVTVEDNLLAGGSYALYAGHNDGGLPTSHVVVTDNHFSTRYFPKGGVFGPACCFESDQPGNVWTGNVWQDGPRAHDTIPPP
jgi:hypothetical protein